LEVRKKYMNPYAGIIRTGSKGFYEIYRKSQPSTLSSPVCMYTLLYE